MTEGQKSKKICSLENCEKAVFARGWCQRHYSQLRPRPECKVEDCNKPSASAGFCGMHYRRVRLYGQTSLPPNAPRGISADDAANEMLQRGFSPLIQYPGSKDDRWPARCNVCGKDSAPTLGSLRQGHGCKWCAASSRGDKLRMDESKAVQLLHEAGADPLDPYPGYNSPWLAKCRTCGAECRPRLADVRRGQGPCGSCRYVKSAAAQRLDEQDADRVFQGVGLRRLEPYQGYFKPILCRCLTCGREVQSRLGNAHRGHGCRWCAGQAIDPDDAVETMLQRGLTPLEEYRSAATPWLCRCNKCQREVSPTWNSIQSGRGGCKWCADSSFDMEGPAVLYLIEHSELPALKIGIAGKDSGRLAIHQRNGWGVVRTWDFESGAAALHVEQQVLSWWKDELCTSQFEDAKAFLPQGGWTEVASMFEVGPEESIGFVEAALEFPTGESSSRSTELP